MAIEWTPQQIANLGSETLEIIISKIGGGVKSTVQLGTLGEGKAPNYQVNQELDIFGKNIKKTYIYNGRSHKEWSKDDENFDDKNLSEPFSADYLNKILKSL
ncbi:hypothetical protein [Photobacterium halotolerans]|uniref:Uncharacterized protein n=1 Tax=Photobacterium halotolerans TaxID=265726 RepID=A0A0F5V730_9GAMM|nr:hypothetical protein [Photobacterium halotolerans]KKC97892.1 hypothetical protein KY46_21365 [Photobacterium halotolerans]